MECDHGEPKGAQYCALCRRAGVTLKDAGMALASESKTEWMELAVACIQNLARSGKPFTAEDVADIVGLPGGSNKAMGAAINRVARSGMIYRYGERPASRKTSHARMLAVWFGGHVPTQTAITDDI